MPAVHVGHNYDVYFQFHSLIAFLSTYWNKQYMLVLRTKWTENAPYLNEDT
jgi:hypothetical protein